MNFRSIFQAPVAVLTWPVKQIFVTERRMGTVTRKETHVLITPAVLVAMLFLLLRDVMASLELLPAAYRFQLDRNANGGWPLQRWPKACQTLMILYPAFFSIYGQILNSIASLLGGRGYLERYAYLIATYGAPLIAIRIVLVFVPVVGSYVFVLYLYEGVLIYFATRAEHELFRVKAIIVTLLFGPVLAVVADGAMLFISGLFQEVISRGGERLPVR